MNFKSLSQTDLFAHTQTAIKEERLSTLRVLHLFREIERRRSFGKHSSLFDLATKQFGYSASAAQRRIQAMRMLKALPEFESKIESGELSLTTAASAQSYFQRSKVDKAKKTELLETCLNKSSREVYEEIASREPSSYKRADMRYSRNDRVRMSVNVSDELYMMIEKLKYQLKASSIEDVIKEAIQLLAASKGSISKAPTAAAASLPDNPAVLNAKNDAAVLPAPVVRARHVPAVTKRIVIKKSEAKCCYKDPATGEECGNTNNLEYDNIHPYSKGGPHLVENLRLMCAPHNKHVWNKEQKDL